MKVKELVKILENVDPQAQVIVECHNGKYAIKSLKDVSHTNPANEQPVVITLWE